MVKLKSEAGLGINLVSTAGGEEDPSVEMSSRHFIRNVQREGAVGKTGLILDDDELLAVSLYYRMFYFYK